jgi:drug/metabolite transporter (DMT)-like permease
LQLGNIGRHKWLRLLLVTGGIYLVLLPLWWQSLPILAMVAATCADALYHIFNSRVSIVPDGSIINVFVTASEQSGFGGQVHSSGLRLSTITYGLPMHHGDGLVYARRHDHSEAESPGRGRCHN